MTGVGAIFELYENWSSKREKKKKAESERNLRQILKEQEGDDESSQQRRTQQPRQREDRISYRIEERLVAYQQHKREEKRRLAQKSWSASVSAGLALSTRALGVSGGKEYDRELDSNDERDSDDNDDSDNRSNASEDSYIDEAVYYHVCIQNNDWEGFWELLLHYDYQHYQEEYRKQLEKVKEAKKRLTKNNQSKRRLRVVRGMISVKNIVLPPSDDCDDDSQHQNDPDDIWKDPSRIISPLLGRDGAGRTPLHSLCALRETSDRIVLRTLQSEKLAAKVADDFGQLPLHIATKAGKSIKVIDKLMRANIPGIAQEDDAGRTALWYCIQRTILTAEYGQEHHDEIPVKSIAGYTEDDIDDMSSHHGHNRNFASFRSFGSTASSKNVETVPDDGSDNADLFAASIRFEDDDDDTTTTTSGYHSSRSTRLNASMQEWMSRSTRSYYHNEDDFVERDDGTTHYATTTSVAIPEDQEEEEDGDASTSYSGAVHNSHRLLLRSVSSFNTKDSTHNSKGDDIESRSVNSSSTNKKDLRSSLQRSKNVHSSRSQRLLQAVSYRSTRTGLATKALAEDATESSSKMLASKIHQIKYTSIQNDPYAKTTWGIPRTQAQIQWQERQEAHWSKVRFMLSAYSARRKIFKPSERELLLWVIDHAAPPSVIEVALFASQKLLKTDPSLASSALQLFMRRQYPIKNLQLLLHHFPVQNREIMDTARRLLTKYYLAGCQKPAGKDSSASDEDNLSFRQEIEQKALNGRKPSLTCAEWWDKCTALLKLCGHENDKERKQKFKKSHLLHAALCNPETPPSLIQLCMVMSPKSISLPHPSNGALLIHLICKSWKYNLFPHSKNLGVEFQLDEPPMEQVLRIVLASDPSLTRRRYERRLPLHHAIATYKPWSFLESLVNVDKLTLAQCDPVTKLYPFQLAASLITNAAEDDVTTNFSAVGFAISRNAAMWARDKNTTAWPFMSPQRHAKLVREIVEQQDLEQLNITYQLLRMLPQASTSAVVISKPAEFRDTAGRGMVSAHFLQFCYLKAIPEVVKANDDGDGSKEKDETEEKEEENEEEKTEIDEESKTPMSELNTTVISRTTVSAYDDLTTDDGPGSKRSAASSLNSSSIKTYVMDGELLPDGIEEQWIVISQNYDLILRAIETKAIPSELELWWERCKFWIWYCYPKELGTICKVLKDSFLLHAALANQDTPPIIVQLILAILPLSASLPTFGMYGNFEYPLHIAARTPAYIPRDFEEPCAVPVLQMVLEAFPEAAHVENAQGLPIKAAMKLGKPWGEIRALVKESLANPNLSDADRKLIPRNQQSYINQFGGSVSAPVPDTSHTAGTPKSRTTRPVLSSTSPSIDLLHSTTGQAWEQLRQNLADLNLGCAASGADTNSSISTATERTLGVDSIPYGQHQFQNEARMATAVQQPATLLGPTSQRWKKDELNMRMDVEQRMENDLMYLEEEGEEYDEYISATSSWRSSSVNTGAGRWQYSAGNSISGLSTASELDDSAAWDAHNNSADQFDSSQSQVSSSHVRRQQRKASKKTSAQRSGR